MDPVTFFKCLSDETRLCSLLLICRETELCVCELMAALDEIQPKVSRHLAQLRKSNLLVDRRQGQWVFYSINPELPAWCHNVLASTLDENADFIDESVERLCRFEGRPERPGACC